MRYLSLILTTSALLLVGGCQEKSDVVLPPARAEAISDKEKPIIRSFRFVGTNDNYGIELNGGRGFLRQDGGGESQVEVPSEKVSALIEDFYGIPDIENFRGKKSDNRQAALQHLVAVYDEAMGHGRDEYVDYVIPKDSVASGSPLYLWLQGMEALKNEVNRK